MSAPPSQPVIAVIDRDRLTAYGLSLLLRDWGYESVIGISAPEIFSRTEALGWHLSAIVADDRLDDGTTGLGEAAALARMAARPIPTVVLISTNDASSVAESAARGFAAVPKPLEPVKLRDLLRSVVTIVP